MSAAVALRQRPAPTAQVRKLRSGRIFLVRAKDHTGHRAYYFVQALPSRAEQFRKALRSPQPVDLEAYGEILASGYGEPSGQVLARMRAEYGWGG